MTEFITKITEQLYQAADELQDIISGALAGDGGGASDSSGSNEQQFDASDFDFGDADLDDMSEEQIQKMLADELMQNNPLQGIADDVTKNIMAGQAQPENPMEHFQAFRAAIHWSEKFIIGLVVFQIVMFFLCFFVSRRDMGLPPRITLMVVIAIIVKSSEWLNARGEEHWESFATQDYFDKKGIFMGIMLSGPLLVDVLMMLLFFLKEASVLLVQVKRTEIQRKKKQQTQTETGMKKTTGNRKKTKKQD